MRKRTLFALCAAALVAVVGVTAALAGSAGRATPVTMTVKPKSVQASPAPGGVVESQTPASDAADYWTPERMRSAEPLEKTVPGGSPTIAPSPQAPRSAGAASTAKAPKATKAPAANPAKKAKKAKKASTATQSGAVSADTSDDAAAYWTPEQMANAAPMQPGVAGGNGSQGSAGPGPVPATP